MVAATPGTAAPVPVPVEEPAGVPGMVTPPGGGQQAWLEVVAVLAERLPARETAALLAGRLARSGAPCGRHKPSAPEENCPTCGDEAALRIYRAAAGMAEGDA